jgi:uncharacterized membrane protein
MSTIRHLWAIGFDDTTRADEVRDEISKLGRECADLTIKDMAVVVRETDGAFTLDRKPLAAMKYFFDRVALDFITSVVVAAPLTGASAGAMLNAADVAVSAALCIDKEFIREVEGLLKPGTSALFLLDEVGSMEKIIPSIRGLGGTVLKTNVGLDHAKLVQSTLAAVPADRIEPAGDLG